jgi:hypothetical protein
MHRGRIGEIVWMAVIAPLSVLAMRSSSSASSVSMVGW